MAAVFPLIGGVRAGVLIAVLVAQGRAQAQDIVDTLWSVPLAITLSASLGAATGLLASFVGRPDRSGDARHNDTFRLDVLGALGVLTGGIVGGYFAYQSGNQTVRLLRFECDAIVTGIVVGIFAGGLLGAIVGETISPSNTGDDGLEQNGGTASTLRR